MSKLFEFDPLSYYDIMGAGSYLPLINGNDMIDSVEGEGWTTGSCG